ncbi:hypothetical protein GYMLUDRAFT_989993 [Collybiopsis luxurians FD-317 M1]|uniref:Integrase zinc-binding domain-containing protein n=1 Tax=Collybiopsis luxurians FD-317 M1 TaxID=944289 RepID=A0A0D0AJ07_9AGAR|nr:hypothetical protein GYMLUDRAFT_989993 [Collybiopsis luxurians FD-317 M1]
MKAEHDALEYRSVYATKALLSERFWWPELEKDINWYVKTCHLCQEKLKNHIRTPPKLTPTPFIFQVLHADTMHMSLSNCKKYFFGCNIYGTSFLKAIEYIEERYEIKEMQIAFYRS